MIFYLLSPDLVCLFSFVDPELIATFAELDSLRREAHQHWPDLGALLTGDWNSGVAQSCCAAIGYLALGRMVGSAVDWKRVGCAVE